MRNLRKSKLANFTVASLLAGVLHFGAVGPAEASTCTTASFHGGDGSSSSPFQISTETQLKNLRFCLGVSHNDKYFEFSNDVVVSSATNIPIGDITNRFMGEVDGQGYALTLPNNMSFGSIARGGLFGFIDSGAVQSITISGAVTGATDIGMLAGGASNSSFVDITTFGHVNGTGSVGGLIGTLNTSTVSNVSVNRNPLITQTFYVTSTLYAGGVVGVVNDSVVLQSEANVPVSSGGGGRAGGLVGSAARSQILESNATGNVNSTDTSIGNTGGLVGMLDDQSVVSRSLAHGNVTGKRAGGLVGYIRSSVIQESHAYGTVTGPTSTIVYAGGLVGEVAGSSTTRISKSSAKGNISITGSMGNNLGGFIGNLIGAITINDSYSTGNVSGGSSASSYNGGFIGFLNSSGVTISKSFSRGTVSGTGIKFPFAAYVQGAPSASNNSFLATTLSTDDSHGSTSLASPLLESSFSEITTFQDKGFSIQFFNQTQQSDSDWLMCDAFPVLSSEPAPDTCPMYPVAGSLDASGQILTITFNGEIAELPENSAFATTPSVAISSIATTSARVLQVQLNSALPGGIALAFSYTKPSDQAAQLLKRSGADSIADSFTFRGIVNNSNLSGPIVLSLASSNLTPTSVDLAFSCGGSCDPSASFDYVASITPAGGSATTETDTTTGTATLSFNNLDPNVAHVISVTVAQGGLTSPAATLNVTTPKPFATISAISVLDTSATLTVGCTNCGAAPDSFTVSATPVAGGPAITSNTNVISSLSSETTYSFSVVIAFAGTTSDLLLWQDNPVMTLPLVPVVSSVSPAAVPLSGGAITVTGANFTTSSLLTLGGTSSAFTIVSGTEITFTAPSGTAGSFDLAITNPVGTFTLSSAITYVSGPSLTTNSPVLATTNGGTIVTLTGTDLATTNQVNVGSTTVSFSVVSDTVVRFTTAATAAGIVDIGVVTVGGADTLSSAIEFTTSALVPVIGAIAPTSGTTAGGTTITVTGQYFSGSYSDSVSAAINGISGSSIVLIDDSTLTFVSPPGAAATGLDVTIATGGGLGTLAGAFSYTAPPAPSTPGSAPPVVINTPTITEFSTREISASGAEVTATGLRLENVSVLTLGGITVTIVANTSTSLTFTTGEMPVGIWDLRLVGSNGTLVFQQAIEVVEATAIVAESTGELLGYTWTLKFIGNSRSLHSAQREHLAGKLDEYSTAETIICWGYTTAENPNAWAIAHATQRAQAACDLALANNSEVRTVVRLRYGVEKSWAMRSALQFWR